MSAVFGTFPFLLKLYADSGYQGPKFEEGLSTVFRQINVEIVKRSDCSKFVVLPKRWIVRKNHRMAQPMSPFGQGTGNASTPTVLRSLLSFRPPDGQKALSNPNMIADGL